jgi:hypothetical protein
MRTFYIFNISDYLAILTKETPYNLFKTLEGVYYLDKTQLDVGISLFEQIAIPFHKDDINKLLFDTYKDNDFYTLSKGKHRLYNKYLNEIVEFEPRLSYILLKTNSNKKSIFQNIMINNHLFACDFQNKDYFWLDSIVSVK